MQRQHWKKNGKTCENTGMAADESDTISSWSYDLEGHAKKLVERYCELADKTTEQLYKVATPCMDDHQCKEENGVGELPTVCSQIVLKLSSKV